MPIGPQYFNKSRRCFTLSLASRVITYHQSKLIIADWVGVVNDYRRGRAGRVSHTVLQSMVDLAKGEEGWGCDPSIWSPLGNYRLSRRPKSRRLNKEMKRNLRKMDEPPGKHPLFIPLVLPMITNALSSYLSLSLFLSARTHTRCIGVRRREELLRGER